LRAANCEYIGKQNGPNIFFTKSFMLETSYAFFLLCQIGKIDVKTNLKEKKEILCFIQETFE
jgi:hypothetical protein